MPKKSRYSSHPFAKGWFSVSSIAGVPEKPFLYGWYYKNCAHTKGRLGYSEIINPHTGSKWSLPDVSAFDVLKESQKIGKLIDTAISNYFEDEDVPKLDQALIEKAGDAKDYYFQSLKNFHAFAEKYKPVSVAGQLVVYSRKHKYIGTLDRLLLIKNKLVLVDWKATNFTGYEYKLQLEGYYRALLEMALTNELPCGILKIIEEHKWRKNNLAIIQLPKKEEIDFDKNIIEFASDDARFENGFLSLKKFLEQKKSEGEK